MAARTILADVDNRLLKRRLDLIKDDLRVLDAHTENHLQQLRGIESTYRVVLDKNKPVGSPANAIRFLKNL